MAGVSCCCETAPPRSVLGIDQDLRSCPTLARVGVGWLLQGPALRALNLGSFTKHFCSRDVHPIVFPEEHWRIM